ncbi:Apc13 domain-containing protein [Magnaporthiopsis poae ATCC 64411]|uniref:Apc13 domain-containing protein n=1 Tax=Magnaporthiopsis poae (strain ATCC 64411 / 73-15) TaxID=644358 RepID=A0A0C4E4C8_MAGP6|nr:Apc13 domain-containing protein [Magnaporthiopsis poae ATCC 64411]
MSQNKDGCYTHVHMHRQRDADLFEDFSKDKLPADDIFVPAHHQPINPEDEDDVVPDQHAAFGITKATQKTREAAWKDLGLAELMHRGPGATSGTSSSAVAPTAGSAKRAAKKLALRYQGMPR